MIRVSSLHKKSNFFCFCWRFSFLNQSFKKHQELKILKPTVENASEIRYIILFSVEELHNFLVKTMQENFYFTIYKPLKSDLL